MSRIIALFVALSLPVTARAVGDEKSEAVQKLLDKLKGGDGKAAVQLVSYGKAAVPGLIKLLEDGNTFVQGHAAHALGRIGPSAKEAVPALAKALSSKEISVAEAAALALGRMGEAAVPALGEALQKGKGPVRSLAATALKGIGKPAAKTAVAPLIAALKDSLKDKE